MNCNTIPHDQSSALVPMRISERQQRQCSCAMAQRIATATTVNIIPKPRPHTTNCSHILYILCVRRSTDRWLNVYTLYIITFLPKIPACTLPALPNPSQHPVNDVHVCLRMCMRAVRLVEPNQSAKENQKRKPFAHKSGTSQTLPAAPRPHALRFAAQAPFQVCRMLGQARRCEYEGT
jgi:hypothetical protein